MLAFGGSNLKTLLCVIALAGLGSMAVAQGPVEGNCPVFPADNIWNARVDKLPVNASSSSWVSTIGASSPLHPDFGSGTYNGEPIGIPYVTVPGSQTKYAATFTYQSESDPGPYAIPLTAPIEGGSSSTGDRHVIAVEPLPKPVTLAAVKAEPKLKDMILARQPRLSVQPVTDAEWALVCKMGGRKS